MPLGSSKSQRYKSPQLNLADQILGEFVESRFDPEPKLFLPAGRIENLVTKETIIKELQAKDNLASKALRLTRSSRMRIVDFVCEKAKIVFAITLLSGLDGKNIEWAMLRFMDPTINLTDESLPIRGSIPVDNSVFRDEYSKSPWTDTRIHNFRRSQWQFLSPVFSQKNFSIELEPQHILPFTMRDDSVREGAFGQVFQVDIHPAHRLNPAGNVRLPTQGIFGSFKKEEVT